MKAPQPQPQPQPQQPVKYAVPLSTVIGAAVLGVVAIILCGVTVIPALISSLRTRAPATTPSATAITPITTATLGGTLHAFEQRYGPAIDDSGLMYTATIAGQRTLIILTLDTPQQSHDGLRRVVSLAVQVPGDALGIETWDAVTADAIARVFLPPDAHMQDSVPLSDGSMTYLYTSEALAASFTPTAAAAPGTLAIPVMRGRPPHRRAAGMGNVSL